MHVCMYELGVSIAKRETSVRNSVCLRLTPKRYVDEGMRTCMAAGVMQNPKTNYLEVKLTPVLPVQQYTIIFAGDSREDR